MHFRTHPTPGKGLRLMPVSVETMVKFLAGNLPKWLPDDLEVIGYKTAPYAEGFLLIVQSAAFSSVLNWTQEPYVNLAW
jgi:hypothetical protein